MPNFNQTNNPNLTTLHLANYRLLLIQVHLKKTEVFFLQLPLAHIHSLVSSIMRYHVVASQLVAPDVALFF